MITDEEAWNGFEIMAGTPGLSLGDVAHVLIPGRGRDATGFGLNPEGRERVRVAARLHEVIGRSVPGGRIVCSGYKSPIDDKGREWSLPGERGQTFCGVPEADLMKQELLRLGVSANDISAERRSIDTVTNLLRSDSEGHFGDDRPVAIVAQADHLRRIVSIIAPRTMKRGFVGVVAAPSLPAQEGLPAIIVSKVILMRLPSDSEQAVDRATTRANRIWRLARLGGMRHYH